MEASKKKTGVPPPDWDLYWSSLNFKTAEKFIEALKPRRRIICKENGGNGNAFWSQCVGKYSISQWTPTITVHT